MFKNSDTTGEIGHRIQYLDGWRAIAILSVIFGHFITPVALNAGRLGVELFFVLSGRLMAEILFDRSAELPNFFARRISRVLPALLTFTAIMTVFLYYCGRGDIISSISAATFTINYYQLNNHIPREFDHIWSLCVEEHCYIFLAIIAFATKRKVNLACYILIAAITLSICLGVYFTYVAKLDYRYVFWRSDVRGASILMGSLAYLAGKKSPDWIRTGIFSIFALTIGTMLQANAVPDPIKYSIGTAALALSLSTLPSSKILSGALSSRLLIPAALLSYSLYLWQQPFFSAIQSGLPILEALASRALLLCAATCLALISYLSVEKPLRGTINRAWSNLRSKSRAVATRANI